MYGKQQSDVYSKTDLDILSLDTRFRNKSVYPNSGHFSYELDLPIKDVISLSLSSIELPNVYHTFSSKKGNISFLFNTRTITIPAGNHGACELIDLLKTLLPELEITIDFMTGRLTFTSKDNMPFTLDFPVIGNPLRPTLGYLLGFRKTQYSGFSSYTAESLIDTIGDHYIYLSLNDYGHVISLVNNNTYLAKLILTNTKQSVTFENRSNFICKTHFFLKPVNISRLSIQLIDPYGDVIDMEGADYSLTFDVEKISNSFVKQRIENAFLQQQPSYSRRS